MGRPKAAQHPRHSESLSLGIDAMVFMDDIRGTRHGAPTAAPGGRPNCRKARLLCPNARRSRDYFEAVAVSAEDLKSARQSQDTFVRVLPRAPSLQKQSGGVELMGLARTDDMLEPSNSTGGARIVQLINKFESITTHAALYEPEVADAEKGSGGVYLQVRLAEDRDGIRRG